MKKKTVFVGLSGGVDSAVSAAILKKQGYEVVGVFIRTWHPDFLKCNEEEERLDAMRVAAHLDIPFLTFDLADIYKKEVADYMIAEYKIGRTPNPDVMCNKEVKFGAFLKKAIAMGADYVATGHYAQNKNFKRPDLKSLKRSDLKELENFYLQKGVDPSKDQSYFLWTLKQEQLKRILFPIGYLKKIEVRKLAKKFNLPVAEKRDSQGICFLGAVDLKDFLKHYIKEKKGKVVLASSGERPDLKELKVIGYHYGVVFHTLGERHGFVITKKGSKDGAYYIVGKDIKKNILYASQDKNFQRLALKSSKKADLKNLGNFYFKIKDTNWISEIPKEDKDYTAQIRYHGEFLSCKIKCAKSNFAQVVFEKPILVASGQSCVIYDKDICLGGGVVI
ncbi:tRNA 2-thiouridine(34) synthase MnmA [Candidatus Nomurabacteria bacterium CG_4_9_14_0_2_um_filter_32_10]|uniref:tRNA-specific 2-thiouridylase MnmA n=3 Tax=Candidatus Nomuraibacteriota TaxID=1752729 RepID=A0A2H0CGU3_9BACT|nr:MAG: tRNA 2-thiouridine(34) synthase MnmA [Candidatus Nomurabacteria bacterium CG22_combo_CG10-13_8_21_14_all_32_8]PIZ86389.1 MAG: tRNA 2-thiouridine(34) synthase MnmA [Candidatus Nomurabacteria bacterium CG_4_10_14_0_2_um_filter_33_9]PJC49501.1 MAG: tRNA 2-thiouridine(34) synthase MnmA [Candidatus Nomurabacteria bacterium CG_4_9_14_0_2_um_filter_32_10]